ncbi:MAG: ribose 5-phosphate isomerase B [Bacteroidetes bacterium]|nr:ribose 5-phosphate isomerase B [Rhodothermia bacterium]MCS7154804.1 ribose 5-phosphate isomerase B [Bacteroidota bacterium]MCX7907039.1 ribose 5-phosphate isomerase B [Bacteroidota bacterium]MDW8137597.1 ribose 5-phosphate isomerase B [Bacteroidota bacterium]MDW8285449.1 ribose 5-phosphate isomerase B [Bacteroidota bacterium]
MKLLIGSDHAGYARKQALVRHLIESGWDVEDLGTHSPEATDYPDYAVAVAEGVARGEAEAGILLCGTGNGVCMTANKVPGIRAALAWNPELARLARAHNNANILCLPARFITDEEAIAIARAWLEAAFEGGRHARRIEKVHALTGR